MILLNALALVNTHEERDALPTLDGIPHHPMSHSLDGSQGRNRLPAERCKIEATHDYDAIQSWLQRYTKAETHRLYQKEAERLLLWSIFQRRLALSSLSEADLMAYFTFLDNPTPADLWCAKSGGKGHKRGMLGWKPFVGGLSASAKNTVFSVLDSLFTFLVKARYLDFNPIDLIRRTFQQQQSKEERRRAIKTRTLPMEVWNALIDTVETWPAETHHEKNEKERLRWLVYLLYFLGLRNSDVSQHTFAAFEQNEKGQWWFAAYGKGDKFALIPVNDKLLTAMQRFRTWFRLSPLPKTNELTPLVPSWRSEKGINSRQINNLLKGLGKKTAELFQDEPLIVEKLHDLSAHWFRHQSASMQSAAGIKAEHIKDNLRHSTAQTTELYNHTFDDARHADMQRLDIKSNHTLETTVVETTVDESVSLEEVA